MPLIELDRVTYTYPEGDRPVLRDLSLSLEGGGCLILRGDNGSGKTTLFRVLNGLAFPERGTYRFDGETIDRAYLSDSRRARAFHKRIGYLFQNPDTMLFNGRVFDEAAFGPRQMGLPEEEVRARTEDCLKLFGIADLSDKAPYHLSGGQKKRVAMAAVLTLNPDVLILDEPLAGLDKKGRDLLTDFLVSWREAGKTLIAATHEESLADLLAGRVLTLT